MTKRIASAAGVSLAFALWGLLIFNSCTSNQTSTTKADTTETAVQSVSVTATTAAPILYLSSLTVSADVINANPNVNIMFVYLTSKSVWELRGWLFENTGGVADIFRPTPDMELKQVKGKRVAIGPNTYLSNLVLPRSIEKEIYKTIRGRKAILQFDPIYNAGPKTVSYEISIEIIEGGKKTLLAERFPVNPCPPHCLSE